MILTDFKKIWLKAKLSQFYRQDPYFKNIDTNIALSHFCNDLLRARTVSSLVANLKSSGTYRAMKISRKRDGETYFEYPSLALQVESLLILWPDVCELYEDQKLLSKGNRFGHRPNLPSNYLGYDDLSEIKQHDIKINCSLKIPFQEDYPAFKSAAVASANEILKKSAFLNAHVLVIQSDIEKFFHRLKIQEMKRFLKDNFRDLSEKMNSYLDQVRTDGGYESLPIGWIISGILADLVLVKYHESLSSKLNKELQSKLKNINLKESLKLILPESEINENLVKEIEGFVSTSSLKYKATVNYVDDFIFSFEFNISEQFKDKKHLKTFEKLVTSIVLEIAERLLNDLFHSKLNLKLYRPDDEKGKHFSFDKSNIDTLTSNFFSIANNTPSDAEDANIWTRLDEFLLPADNDLTLNERTQFFAHLASLRHKVLEGENLLEDRDDIFQKILLKIKGSEAKYISSVLRLIEVMVVSDYENNIDFCLNSISNIINEFESSNKSLDLWLRFFQGYFRIYNKLSFDSRFKFYDDLDKFIMMWSQQVKDADDKDLLNAVRVTYLLKSILKKNEQGASLFEIMSRRKKGSRRGDPVSMQFFPFSVNAKSKKIGIHYNTDGDNFSIASLVKVAAQVRKIEVNEYLSIGQKISRTKRDSAIVFYNLTAVGVLPKWSKEELHSFFDVLPNVTSKLHARVLKRVIKLASAQHKSIGGSYFERLEHLRKTLVENGDVSISNVPKIYGGGDRSDYRSVIFYLATLDSNCLQDLQRAYLSSLVPIDNYRDVSYLHVPIALRRTGLAFVKILREVTNALAKSFSEKLVKKICESIVSKELADHSPTGAKLDLFKRENVCEISLSDADISYSLRKETPLLMTLCPIGIDHSNDFDYESGLVFNDGVHEKLDLRIESAINEAKKRGADVIVFPELTLPRRYFSKYLFMCASKNLVLIAGVEYVSDKSKEARNATVISFPVNKSENPYSRGYVAFEQDKHYPAAEEKDELEKKSVFKYSPGECLFVFKSIKFSNFAVLTCSDFLSLRLRLKLQEKVQTVFVPAQNLDTTTYMHIAESSIRDLHCFAVVCNNQEVGGSFVFAPFREPHERTIFRKDGATLPEFLTMRWEPGKVLSSQKADSQRSFKKNDNLKKMKQTPPDWGY